MGSNGDVPAVPRTNGGFFRPSVNAATTAQTTSTLDSAIEHMRQVLNIDGQEDTSNAERARRVFLDVVPAGIWYVASKFIIIIIYYSWNGGRAEAACAGGKGVRMR
jgi:hypothetical protein